MQGIKVSEVDLNKIGPQYRCNHCLLILRDPVQTECAHHFCRTCINSLLGSKKEAKCPKDGCLVKEEKVFSDAFVWREIQSTVVLCLYHVDGCKWQGEIRVFEIHVKECQFMRVSCVFQSCGALVSRKDLPFHLENECIERNVRCSYCSTEVALSRVKLHEDADCPAYPVTCSLCHKKDIPRAELSQHYDPCYGDCEEFETACSYSAVGCEETKGMKKTERKDHEVSFIVFHLSLLLGFVLRLRDKIQEVLNEWDSFREDIGCLKALKATLSDIVSQIKTLLLSNTEIKEVLKSQDERVKSLEKEKNCTSRTQGYRQDDVELRKRVHNNTRKSSDNEVQIVQLVTTIEDLKLEVGSLRLEMGKWKDLFGKLEKRMENSDTMQAVGNLAIADLQECVQEQDHTHREGVLLWKISQFAKRRNDAVTGNKTSFYSPCFYSSHHGYKMCARIYLNGDGMGRGTHISLFFVLMRGEHDALLPWPFKQKVTMMLLDQDKEEHVIDAFRPDSCSSSFQRPKTEMNVASGCPTFCALSELTRYAYIRDDCMFIKMIVDKTIM